jgi:hypothetical protein
MVKYSFNIMKELLKQDSFFLKNKDEDNLLVLTGKEGKGKSRLGLWAIDTWFEIHNIPKTEENFKDAMGVKLTEWTEILCKNSTNKKHCSINDFDEAGDVLSGKHANNKVVRAVEDAYKVIRGMNMLSILTTPSLFVLSPYLRYHRVKVVWWVEKRGLCHVFFGKNLYLLMSHNEKTDFKDMSAVEPNFSFIYPDYKGVFLKPYLRMKDNKMYEILGDLHFIATNNDDKIKPTKKSKKND